jgi:hypothetical protein
MSPSLCELAKSGPSFNTSSSPLASARTYGAGLRTIGPARPTSLNFSPRGLVTDSEREDAASLIALTARSLRRYVSDDYGVGYGLPRLYLQLHELSIDAFVASHHIGTVEVIRRVVSTILRVDELGSLEKRG